MGVIGNLYRFAAYGLGGGYAIMHGYHKPMNKAFNVLTLGGLDSLVQKAHNASQMIDFGTVAEIAPLYAAAFVAIEALAKIGNGFEVKKK